MSLTEKLFGSVQPKDPKIGALFQKKAPVTIAKGPAAAAAGAGAGGAEAAGGAGAPAETAKRETATFVDPAKLFKIAPPAQRETRRQRQARELEARMLAAKKGVAVEVKTAGKKRHLSHGKDDHAEEDRRTVFVGNLPNDIDRRKIEKFFKSCGEIESVRVRCQVLEQPKEGDSKSRGRAVRILRGEIKKDPNATAVAYVLFKSEASVAAAVAKSGGELCGRHLSISTEDAEGKAFMPRNSLFLGNLAYDVCDEEVWKFFIDAGFPPVHVRIIRDRESGQAKGFGYVAFADAGAVEGALQLREGGQIRGRDVRICHVQKSKSMSMVPSRRDKRKEQLSALPAAGPLAPGAKRGGPNAKLQNAARHLSQKQQQQQGGQAKPRGGDAMPWMGVTTNPRKKMPRDLRPLVEPPKSAKDKKAKRGPPPPAKKKAAAAPSS